VRTLGAQNETEGFRDEVSYALRQKGDEFLDSIVTGDETWVFRHTPESSTTMMRCKKKS
jgi:hypothetical protein